jgi:hypothetical protein
MFDAETSANELHSDSYKQRTKGDATHFSMQGSTRAIASTPSCSHVGQISTQSFDFEASPSVQLSGIKTQDYQAAEGIFTLRNDNAIAVRPVTDQVFDSGVCCYTY